MGGFVLALIISGSILGYIFLATLTRYALRDQLRRTALLEDTRMILVWFGMVLWPLVLPTIIVIWVVLRIDRGAGWLYRLLTGGS